MKKAQVIMEFILFTMLGIALVTALVAVAINMSTNVLADQNTQQTEELARSIQTELLTASEMRTGYNRKLELPKNLRGGSYTITNDKETITLTSIDGVSITLATPPTQGTLQKGTNTITHEKNNTITIK